MMSENVDNTPVSASFPVPVRYSTARRQVPRLVVTVNSPSATVAFAALGVHDLVPLSWSHHTATATWVALMSKWDPSTVVGWVLVAGWYQDPAPVGVGYIPPAPPAALVDTPSAPVAVTDLGAHTAPGQVAVHIVALRKVVRARDGMGPASSRATPTVWLKWAGRAVAAIKSNTAKPGADGTVWRSCPDGCVASDAGVVLNQHCVVPWAPSASSGPGAVLPPLEVVVTMVDADGVASEEVLGSACVMLPPGVVAGGHFADMWVPIVGAGEGTCVGCGGQRLHRCM